MESSSCPEADTYLASPQTPPILKCRHALLDVPKKRGPPSNTRVASCVRVCTSRLASSHKDRCCTLTLAVGPLLPEALTCDAGTHSEPPKKQAQSPSLHMRTHMCTQRTHRHSPSVGRVTWTQMHVQASLTVHIPSSECPLLSKPSSVPGLRLAGPFSTSPGQAVPVHLSTCTWLGAPSGPRPRSITACVSAVSLPLCPKVLGGSRLRPQDLGSQDPVPLGPRNLPYPPKTHTAQQEVAGTSGCEVFSQVFH